MKKNDWILLLCAALYSYLFYLQAAGINFALFTLCLITALVVRDKALPKKKTWQFAAAGSLLSALCIMYYGNTLSVVANIISLSLLSAFSAEGQSSLLFALLFSFYSYVSSLLFMCIARLERKKAGDEEKSTTSVKKIALLAIPLTITLVFFFMYRASNIIFNDFAAKINLDFISWTWISFTLGGFILLFGFFYHRKISIITQFDERSLNTLDSANTNTISLFGKKLNIGEEDFSGKALFIMLNLLLLMVNALDINFLFVDGKLPKGLSYSAFVHQGTGMLITSILVAIAVILFYFRGALNFYQKSKTLKLLAYIWIAQNVFMLFSTAMRNEMYINEYGLTHKRIGVYVYLLLAATGLITTFFKITKAKSNMYLLRSNSRIFYSALILSAFFNWDYIITDFNIHKAGQLDKDYLVKLSNTNLAQLYIFRQDTLHKHKEFSADPEHISSFESDSRNNWDAKIDFEKELNNKLFFFLRNNEEQGWKSWHYDESIVNEQLRKLNVYNTIYKLDLSNTKLCSLSGLQHFSSLKKLNLYNNFLYSIEGIQTLKDLEELDLSRNYINDVTPLYGLKNLKQLLIDNLSPVQFKNLQTHLPNTLINYIHA